MRQYAGGRKSNKNSRFQRGSGVYKCADCGRNTRETGEGESATGMCLECYTAQLWANGINDGNYTLADVPENLRAKVEEYLEQ